MRAITKTTRMRALICTAVATSFVALTVPAFAASAEDFKAALAKAEAANKRAGEIKNQWTTTAQAIAEAKKAAGGGNFDQAIALAQHAEALANASIAQAKEQETLWRDAVIR
jgi:hypothetical protein